MSNQFPQPPLRPVLVAALAADPLANPTPSPRSVARVAAEYLDCLHEQRTSRHAENMSSLEHDVLAALWNHHPRPLLVSEIYLAVRSSSDDALAPCAMAVTRLASIGLLTCSGAPSFHYQLTRQGIFAAFYLAISGVSDKFTVAEVDDAPATECSDAPCGVERSDENEDFCHSGCGRIATAACDCGNAVCSTHRYNADGQHDPAGVCSTCYDEISMER